LLPAKANPKQAGQETVCSRAPQYWQDVESDEMAAPQEGQ
jgi:hypothetical protein